MGGTGLLGDDVKPDSDTSSSECGGAGEAESEAVSTELHASAADLARVVASWPRLSPETRLAILAVISKAEMTLLTDRGRVRESIDRRLSTWCWSRGQSTHSVRAVPQAFGCWRASQTTLIRPFCQRAHAIAGPRCGSARRWGWTRLR